MTTDIDKKFQKLLNDYDNHCRRIARASVVDINEAPADKLKRICSLEQDYVRWFEYYFPNYAKVRCSWFQKEFADMMIGSSVISCLLEWYRSGAKSVHADMGVPLFLMFTGRMLSLIHI